MNLSTEIRSQIEKDIQDNKVMVYIKGTPQSPQCGFSAQVVQILDNYGVKYGSKNVLEDEELRDGIKLFTDWPTIPQIFISGEFIGGCDIMNELAQSGELEKMLKVSKK
jgi:monothiol glutaredoxin